MCGHICSYAKITSDECSPALGRVFACKLVLLGFTYFVCESVLELVIRYNIGSFYTNASVSGICGSVMHAWMCMCARSGTAKCTQR